MRSRPRVRARFWVALGVAVVVMAGSFPSNADMFAKGLLSSTTDESRPTPTGETQRIRPPAQAAGDGPFKFISVQEDSDDPVGYDPCKTVQVVMNDRTAPPGATELVAEALLTMSEATGLQFVFEGTTDEVAEGRVGYQPDRYGDRWAPVLIEWSDAMAAPDLGARPEFATDVLGYASSIGWSVSGSASVFVTGAIVLDGPELAELEQDEGTDAISGVILHELAHVVGLEHVSDPTQLMFEFHVEGINTLQPGDLLGLAAVGAGACQPAL